jgi:hypothetical protein
MIGSTHFDKTLQKEKGGSTKDRYRESFPGLPDPVEARTSLTIPKDCKTSCFYLYEIENLGGD